MDNEQTEAVGVSALAHANAARAREAAAPDVLEVRLELWHDAGAADVGDLLRQVAQEIEREPHWETTSAPVKGPDGAPIGHWRVIDGGPRGMRA